MLWLTLLVISCNDCNIYILGWAEKNKNVPWTQRLLYSVNRESLWKDFVKWWVFRLEQNFLGVKSLTIEVFGGKNPINIKIRSSNLKTIVKGMKIQLFYAGDFFKSFLFQFNLEKHQKNCEKTMFLAENTI